ncbi:hypothetical protein KP509_39G042800 [Ceratopteris richardii]|uniref:Pentatricopeptide repeat-containing protein n=1 Tax=Ceratopteris richardii TaxID=49495 RepID=A0A8T2Q0T0_CERRI|nr:hypothetical protein KP509_39G042800 [Ceratopteris richardii]
MWNLRSQIWERQYLGEQLYFKALELIDSDGILPDNITFVSGLKACGKICATKKGTELHAKIARRGSYEQCIDGHVYVLMSNALMDMYVKCGSILKAEEVFDCITSRDLISWNTLISGFMLSGDNGRVFSLFDRMRREGQQPDSATFASILRCCSQAVQMERCELLLESMGKYFGISPSLKHYTCVIGLLARCAVRAVACPSDPYVRVDISLIVGTSRILSGAGGYQALLEFKEIWERQYLGEQLYFKALELIDSDGILPDNVTFVSGLKACGKICATKKGTELHAEIARRGSYEQCIDGHVFFESDVLMSNALMDMYVKCGSILKAEEVFDCITSRDLISWNTLISGFMLSGDNGRVFSLFDRMRREGQQPDSATFASILRCCSQAVQMQRCELLLESMGKYFGISPSLKHYTCVIGLLARCGWLHQAAFRIINLPFDPDTIVLLTVLDACRKLGIKQLGQINGYTKHPGKSSVAALLF